MKKPILSLGLSLTLLFSIIGQKQMMGQDATTALITAASGAGGYLMGKAFNAGTAGTAALAAGVPTLANFGYSIFKNKSDEDKIKYYISGRNYERWIRSQETWYQSTLDPYTGRPQAFSGLNAMNDGIPQENSEATDRKINQVYTVPIKMPAGTYEGTPYTERITAFPKLP